MTCFQRNIDVMGFSWAFWRVLSSRVFVLWIFWDRIFLSVIVCHPFMVWMWRKLRACVYCRWSCSLSAFSAGIWFWHLHSARHEGCFLPDEHWCCGNLFILIGHRICDRKLGFDCWPCHQIVAWFSSRHLIQLHNLESRIVNAYLTRFKLNDASPRSINGIFFKIP